MKSATKKPRTKKPTEPTKKSDWQVKRRGKQTLAIEAAAGLPIMPAMASALVNPAGVRLNEVTRLFVEHPGRLHHVVCDAGVWCRGAGLHTSTTQQSQ